MSSSERPPAKQDLVYMVTGDDDRGDHHIFVTTDLVRAEAKRQTMLALFTNVKAKSLEHWEVPGQ